VKSLPLALLLALAITVPAAAGQPVEDNETGVPWLTHILDRFEFLPEYHLTGDIYFLALYKNADYWRRYFVENNADMELFLAGYSGRLYASLGLYVRTTMGRQDGAIMFDPRELRYVIDPALELRLEQMILRAGLDHTCFHEIDSWDGSTEYWNKAYGSLATKNCRPIEYRRRLINEGRWDAAARFAGEARFGHYLKRAFGLMDPVAIGGNHDYDWELSGDGRCALFKRLDWVVNARSQAGLNLSRSGLLRHRYLFGFEGHFRRGGGGLMLFVSYHLLDQMTVRPKDRLMEIGVRFYN